jgi:hypothetical protein
MNSNHYTIYLHDSFNERLAKSDIAARKKYIQWTQLQLAMTGRTPKVKGTNGHEYLWRRTPIQGCHYYLWWIPFSAINNINLAENEYQKAIFIRDIRHHDQTDQPLSFGGFEQYDQLDISQIDPRDEQQQEIAILQDFYNSIQIKTVNGIPGSGKTVALQYAAKDLLGYEQKIFYITYTQGLKQQAKQFFQTYKVLDKVTVYTLNELVRIINQQPSTYSSKIEDDLLKFCQYIQKYQSQKNLQLGEWQQNLRMLWIEIRAYLLGMALPFSWERQGIGMISPSHSILDLKTYRKIRPKFSSEITNYTYNLARIIVNNHQDAALFTEQYQTQLALQTIAQINPPIFQELGGIIVDEIQDFTLLEIALLIEIGNQASKQTKQFKFILAGDESQTVYPSGFDWGITKDLFRAKFQIDSIPFSLNQQKRSPYKLEKLINDTWNLYRQYIPKEHIPHSDLTESAEPDFIHNQGIFLIWQLENDLDWNEVLSTLNEYPNLALIDLDNFLNQTIINLTEDSDKILARIKHNVKNIKGLEREIIVVFGLNQTIKILDQIKSKNSRKFSEISLLTIRNIIDNIRVALSRSNNILILAETEYTAIENSLDLSHATVVNWSQLQHRLSQQTEDMDLLEKIMNYLNNAQENINNNDYEKAKLENQKAFDLLAEIADRELDDQVEKQREIIYTQLIENSLKNAVNYILQQQFKQAIQAQKKASDLTQYFSNTELNKQLTAINYRLELQAIINEFNQYLDQLIICQEEAKKCCQKYQEYSQKYQDILAKIKPDILRKNAQQTWQKLENRQFSENETTLDIVARGFWDQAEEAKLISNWPEYVTILRQFIRIRQQQQKSIKAAQCIVERYEKLAPPITPLSDNLKLLISFADQYAKYIETVDNPQKREFLIIWINEIVEIITNYPEFYPEISPNIIALIEHHKLSFLAEESQIKSLIEISRQHDSINHTLTLCKLLKIDRPQALTYTMREFSQIKTQLQQLINSEYYQSLSEAERVSIKNSYKKLLNNL